MAVVCGVGGDVRSLTGLSTDGRGAGHSPLFCQWSVPAGGREVPNRIVSSPSDDFGATSPWRGTILGAGVNRSFIGAGGRAVLPKLPVRDNPPASLFSILSVVSVRGGASPHGSYGPRAGPAAGLVDRRSGADAASIIPPETPPPLPPLLFSHSGAGCLRACPAPGPGQARNAADHRRGWLDQAGPSRLRGGNI